MSGAVFWLQKKFRPRSGEHHPEFPQTIISFGSNDEKQRPQNVGDGVLWFACWLFPGGVCAAQLCCRASCGLDAVYEGPDVMF